MSLNANSQPKKNPEPVGAFFFLSLESGLDTAIHHQKTLIG
ncbi:hypothetical protein PS662_04129 [Pseudomonas fluorescens]|uniref:Uncharacterized protein n=1 Tax=Pseudomonas fluorescens TaxID=294 RepID=A0A5E6VF89_PSEFL|nr:hypothetical protein [Pseudomonas fluorescens]VVN16567.1 hypothetical protein PS662_04129 [Pseudomonas fluorescens]